MNYMKLAAVTLIVTTLATSAVRGERSCARPYSHPVRSWIDAETGELFVSRPALSKDFEIVYSQPTRLEVRGMGYSPIPVGARKDAYPYGDYYTNDYEYLWSVDIPRMADIGVNVVRLWTFKSFDAPNHIGFLDELFRNKMFALIPFEMLVPMPNGERTFEDLTKDGTRRDAVRQFTAFAKELISHPAVLGFVIGNEMALPENYGQQVLLFFTVINEMIAELRTLEAKQEDLTACRRFGCRHFVTTPQKADQFEMIYTQYSWSNIDFWSFQPYYGSGALTAALNSYTNFSGYAVGVTTDRLKPVLITERGTGSVRATISGVNLAVVDDEDFQADFLVASWEVVSNFSSKQVRNNGRPWAPALGMVIMEWNDEWWKGEKNTLQLEGCPEDDENTQSNCGSIADVNTSLVIAEEKLGICSQVKPNQDLITTLFFGKVQHDLKCKKAFTAVCNMWSGRKCNQVKISRVDNSGASALLLSLAPLACFFVTLVWGAILLCMRAKHVDERENELGSGSSASAMVGTVTVDTANAAKRFNRLLTDTVDVTTVDPRLNWILEDLLRRADIRQPHNAEPFRLLWASTLAELAAPRQNSVLQEGGDDGRSSPFIEEQRRLPAKRFGDADVSLAGFADAVAVLHKETMAYVGIHHWRELYKIKHHARTDEPDVQLQEIVLYYSVRLEHHAIGHAVEFVTENFLTMREALILPRETPLTGDERAAAWAALANRIDAAYNIMCNGQLCHQIRYVSGTSFTVHAVSERDGEDTTTAELVDATMGEATCTALRFRETEEHRFLSLAGALDHVRGEETVVPLHPTAIDVNQRLLIFGEAPERRLGEDLKKYARRHTANLLVDVSQSLLVLHSAGVAHGSINCSHVGRYTFGPDKKQRWVLLPAVTMTKLTSEAQQEDLIDLGELLDEMAVEMAFNKEASQLITDVAGDLQRPPMADLAACIERLESGLEGVDLHIPEKPPSYEDLNQTALDQRTKYGRKNATASLVEFRRSFVEKGGLMAAFCNYSFFLRYMLWQWLYSWTSQPVSVNRPVCLQRTLELIAVADALLCFFTYLAEVRLLKGGTHRLKFITAALWMVFYLAAAVGLYFLMGFRITTIALVLAVINMDLVISPHSLYVLIIVALFLVKDIVRFATAKGRGEHRFYVKPGFQLSSLGKTMRVVLYTLNWVCIIVPLIILTDFTKRDRNPTIDTIEFFLPSLVATGAVILYNVLLGSVSTACGYCGVPWLKRLVIDEQLGAPAIFWALNYFTFNAAMTYLIVPGVAFVDWHVCANVNWQRYLACNVAWIFNWAAFIVISFALFGVLYIMWSLLASLLLAFARSIGELHTISDVVNNMKAKITRERVVHGLLRNVHCEPDKKIKAAAELFEMVLQGLVDEHKMSRDEKDLLLYWFVHADKKEDANPMDKARELKKMMAGRGFRLANDEADMVLVMFFSALQHLPHRRGFDVQSMPSFTIVVPHYNETVYHDFKSMRCQPSDLASGVPSDLRHAAAMWPDEWRRLVEDLQLKGLLPFSATGDELLETYHRYCDVKTPPPQLAAVIREVELWITYRNQTLARITRGLGLLRKGLVAIARLELSGSEAPKGPDADLDTLVEATVNQKMQILIGAQTMARTLCCTDPDSVTGRMPLCQLTQLLELQAANPFVEYVFDVDLPDGKLPVSNLRRLLEHSKTETRSTYSINIRDSIIPLCGTASHFCGTRYYSCHLRLVHCTEDVREFELVAVERPGPLLLGPKYRRVAPRGLHTQGKAENQFHTAQFARGSNFFTLDMNQDMCISEGFKLPTMLHHFLGGNKRHRYGIVGFTERCYTRTTSLSGELAGASEFAFVTIVQRVLRSALRIRMHYGHPDLMSGLLARTIGFNKASHGVNVNEDIFAGYECLARGVPIGFCEWIWFWKGRDTSLRLVAIFNNKLAEGAAQQVRSRDMHFLNANLDWLSRSSLLFGTVGFYWMSVLLYGSIRLYLWALILFEVSGVSNFELGVANGVISVAWAFQLGYVMAFPGLIENTVQYGLVPGIMRFLRFVVPSVFFHAFMLQVVNEGFLTGLFTNAASYAGTGRGYDLTPVDAWKNFMIWGYSHYWNGVELLLVLVWYASITAETGVSYFIRTVTVWALVATLFGAPFFFQCPPGEYDLSRSGAKLWKWMFNRCQTFGTHEHLVVVDKIEEAERRSYRTWFTRRFASPLYAAAVRGTSAFNFLELLAKTMYRELPAVALMLCYFSLQMVPLMITASMLFIQAVLLRRMFSGRYQRHFSRIMLITVLVFIVCVTVFYLAARVLFFAPLVSLILVAYFLRCILVLGVTFGTVRGTLKSFTRAGMNLAMLDYPAAIISGVITYSLAWVGSKVMYNSVISWNTSARYSQECRRAEYRRFSLCVRSLLDENDCSDMDEDFDEFGDLYMSKPDLAKLKERQDQRRERRRNGSVAATPAGHSLLPPLAPRPDEPLRTDISG
jgi:hypothetical protein